MASEVADRGVACVAGTMSEPRAIGLIAGSVHAARQDVIAPSGLSPQSLHPGIGSPIATDIAMGASCFMRAAVVA